MKMIKTRCPICNSLEDYTIIYKSNFSDSDINIKVFSARRLPDLIHYQIVKCKNDDLLRSNPICDDISQINLYKNSKFNYSDQLDNLTASYLKALYRILPKFSKDAKILEVGCGNGFMLSALLDLGYNNLHGIELSLDAIARADSKIKDKIIADVFRDGIYKNESFDLIFFFQIFDHLQDPTTFLNICNNLLFYGGHTLCFNHDVESLSSRVLGEKSPIVDIEHTYLYSKKTITKIFTKNGFRMVEVYSPKNIVSLKYLIWLFPMHRRLKLKLLNLKGGVANFLFRQKVNVSLGNLCIIAKKEAI